MLLAVTAGFVGSAAGPVPVAGAQDAPDPVAITTGDLDWGVRQSFRTYVGEHGITVFDGVTRGAGGTFHWPLESGTYDEATKATVLQFAGRVNFHGHEGALDLNVARPRLEITEAGGVLYADMSGIDHDGNPFDDPGAEIATVAVDDAEPVVTDTTTTWSDLQARLAEAGVDAFAGFYSVGAILDDVHATYEGPGGKPDLEERWSRPGTPTYEVVTQRDAWGLRQVTRALPDEANGVVHVVTINAGTMEPSVGLVQALDIDTFEPAGPAKELPWEVRNQAAFWDAEASRVLVTPRYNATGIYALTFDPATGAYGDPAQVSTASVNEAAFFDAGTRTIYGLVGGWEGNLHTHGIADDDTITHTDHGSVPGIYPRTDSNIAVDSLGRVVIGTSAGLQADAAVVDLSTSPPTITRVPGTSGLETVETTPDGGLVFAYGGTIKRFTLEGADYVLADESTTGIANTESEVDPSNGTLFTLLGGSSGQVSTFVDGELTQQLDWKGFGTNLRLAWADGALIGYHPHYEEPSPGEIVDGTRLLRIEQIGTTPAVVAAPEATTVTVPTPIGTVPASFTVEATGDPAPAVQWQSRAGGVGRFADIPGATGATLDVDATASITGTEYRAVLTNAAGAVATEPALLTVHAAPSVLQQPTDVAAVAGGEAELKVMPAGNPYPDITWQRYVAGFWVNITDDTDGFVVDGGFLTVTDTNVDQDGARFRARLRNEVGTVHTRTATLAVTEAPSGTQHVVGGDLDWGVRQSFRTYITGPIAHGAIAVEDGATTDEDGTFGFPAAAGTVDGAVVDAGFGGAVHFTGHVGMGTPAGVPALDMRVSDIRISVDGQAGTLVADVTSRGLASGSLETYDDVHLADLDLSAVTPSPVEGGMQWTGVPATLTEAGVPAFADFYPAGSDLDPLTFTLELSDEPPASRTAVESFAAAALTDFLGTEPTDVQVEAAVAEIGSTSKAAFLRALSTSDAWLAAVVDGLYEETLGRPASDGDRAYWSGQIRGGWTVARVAASFYAADEYYAGIGGGTDETWVEDLYTKLLGRAGEPGGVGYWVGETASKGRGNVALRFFQTPESARTRVEGLYQDLLGRGADADGLTHWAGVVTRRGDLALAVHLAASGEYQARSETRFP